LVLGGRLRRFQNDFKRARAHAGRGAQGPQTISLFDRFYRRGRPR
jgi:hypothetical protein